MEKAEIWEDAAANYEFFEPGIKCFY